MDKFKEACRQSCEDWANSFDDSQEYEFSSAFENKMEKLTEEVSTKKQNKPSKKTIALLVNAAVILCFCAAVFIVPASREKTVGIFKDFISSGSLEGEELQKPSDFDTEIDGGDCDYGSSSDERNGVPADGAVTGEQTTSSETFEINLRYIPDGFTFDDSPRSGGWKDDEQTAYKCYIHGGSRFEISKYTGNISMGEGKYENVYIAGIYYKVIDDGEFIHIFWSENSAYYTLSGENIDRDELLKIAANAE